jgi:tRNA nucleotidyltransferase (CCA-adding enzyme)
LPDWSQAKPEQRRQWMLAVLAHDFGKPATTLKAERKGRERWISPGHEAAGGPPTESFLRRIGAPLDLAPRITPLVLHHLAHHHGTTEFSDSSVRRLARKLVPASIDDLIVVMRADHDGRPPLQSPDSLARIEALSEKARALALQSSGPQPLILGRHLIALGHSPGPGFKSVLEAAFEAQLDGAFTDEPSGQRWLENYLREDPTDLP